MQEMSKNDIEYYMRILQRILIPNNFFVLINRKKISLKKISILNLKIFCV